MPNLSMFEWVKVIMCAVLLRKDIDSYLVRVVPLWVLVLLVRYQPACKALAFLFAGPVQPILVAVAAIAVDLR